MAFSRKSLEELGLEKGVIDRIMILHGGHMDGYVSKEDLQAKIDDAVEKAKKDIPSPDPPDIKESEEYKKLLGEFDSFKNKTETSGTLKKNGVKEKFLDQVYSMISDPEDKRSLEEKIKEVREKYEEYFDGEPPKEEPTKPQFGAGVEGGIPHDQDTKGETLGDIWGFKKRKDD